MSAYRIARLALFTLAAGLAPSAAAPAEAPDLVICWTIDTGTALATCG